jgi:catechol 2,3-dioxygenase-like lactoylglutathione lyase family enzyme
LKKEGETMSCGVEHLAVCTLPAADPPAAAAFYRDVIGLRPLPHHGHRPAFALGRGAFLVLVAAELPVQGQGEESFPALALAVTDLEAAVARLKAHDVEALSAIRGHGATRWVTFRDPAGNLLEFVHGMADQ